MIDVIFLTRDKFLIGFDIKGHAGNSKTVKSRLVCAAVSSAAIMAANTMTEVLNAKVETKTNDDGFLFIKVKSGDVEIYHKILRGLEIHLEGLKKNYPGFLAINKKEVKNVKN